MSYQSQGQCSQGHQIQDSWQRLNAALMQEIQDERVRELFAEGNRLFDMKRWKIGMKRSSSDAQRDDYLPALGTDIEKEATDNRWVWPIPKDEMDSNPQLKGQQNPGY